MPFEPLLQTVLLPRRLIIRLVKSLLELVVAVSVAIAFRVMAGIFDAILRGLGGDSRVQYKSDQGQQTRPDTTHTGGLITDPSTKRDDSVPTPITSYGTDESVHIAHPGDEVILMSPIRAPSSAHHSTPRDSSLDTSHLSSISTPPVDLSFGPQSVPFVFLRRKGHASVDTPSKPPPFSKAESRPIRIVPAASPAVMSGTTSITPLETTTKGTDAQEHSKASLESGEIIEQSDSEAYTGPVEYEVVDPREMGMSHWRKEQLRFMKSPKLVKDTVLKPIPTLYGPLSLPYARNPSGVDATLAEEPVQLSDIFSKQPTRAPTGLSTVHRAAMFNNVSRPKVTISKDDANSGTVNLSDIDSSNSPEPTRDLASSVSSTKSAPAMPASAMLRAQLGVAHKLEPIPGSPSVGETNPIETLFAQATAGRTPTAPSAAGTGQLTQTVLRNAPQGPIAGVNFGVAQRIPSDETTQSSQSGTGTTGSGSHSGTNSSRLTHSLPVTPQVSKADKSVNWRDRLAEVHDISYETPLVTVTTPNKSTIQVAETKNPNEEVMTIDALFERFSNTKTAQRDVDQPITVNPPHSTQNNAHTSTLLLPAETATATPPPSTARAPLGEALGANANAVTKTEAAEKSRPTQDPTKSPAKSSSDVAKKGATAEVQRFTPPTSSKGTPDAGKLLRKSKAKAGIEGDKSKVTAKGADGKDKVSESLRNDGKSNGMRDELKEEAEGTKKENRENSAGGRTRGKGKVEGGEAEKKAKAKHGNGKTPKPAAEAAMAMTPITTESK